MMIDAQLSLERLASICRILSRTRLCPMSAAAWSLVGPSGSGATSGARLATGAAGRSSVGSGAGSPDTAAGFLESHCEHPHRHTVLCAVYCALCAASCVLQCCLFLVLLSLFKAFKHGSTELAFPFLRPAKHRLHHARRKAHSSTDLLALRLRLCVLRPLLDFRLPLRRFLLLLSSSLLLLLLLLLLRSFDGTFWLFRHCFNWSVIWPNCSASLFSPAASNTVRS